EPCAKARGIAQVAGAQRATRGAILVGGADAAAGGPDRRRTSTRLPRLVERDVVRKDQRRGLAQMEASAHLDADRLELIDLLQQRGGRDDDAAADVAMHAGAQDARRN